MSLRARRSSAPPRAREPAGSLDDIAAQLARAPARRTRSLDEVAAQLGPTQPRRSATLDEVAAELAPVRRSAELDAGALRRLAAQLADPAPSVAAGTMDLVAPARPVALELIGGRGHYDRVIAAVRAAHTSVWIATANVKALMIEDGRAAPGRRRTMSGRRTSYVSVLAILDELAARGVELRLLHAELPSGPFRAELAHHPRLVAGGLALRRCPRVHMKAVIVDGQLLYLGSANWTGAGLGAKGSGRRNFELGIVTDDSGLLDQVQAMYEHVWRGGECDGCKLREVCPGPLAELGSEVSGPATEPAGTAPARRRGGASGAAPARRRAVTRPGRKGNGHRRQRQRASDPV